MDVENLSNIDIIPVDVHRATESSSAFIDHIEVLPLETNDSSIVTKGRIIAYNKGMDAYAIYNSHHIVATFDGNGRFIGSSQKVKGGGPEEYTMALDIKFNPYLNGIDLLNPYGIIYTYSLDFDFIQKRTLKPEFVFDGLLPLSKDEYIFSIPNVWVNQELVFADLNSQAQYTANYGGTISAGNSLSKVWFYQENENYYFIPQGVNYYIYQIDKDRKELIPIVYLDFGDDSISEEELPGRATGERTNIEGTYKYDKKRIYYGEELQERFLYVFESDLIVPSYKLFNKDYVYIYLSKSKRAFGTYIYNRKQEKGFFLKYEKPSLIPPCFWIEDNVLMAISDAFYAKEYVIPSLMSPEEMKKIENLDDEDNPVIFKYYLK